MLDSKKIFEKANQDYMDYQRRVNTSSTNVTPLSKAHEFVIKALIEEFYKDPKEQAKKPKTSFLDFTKNKEENNET